MILVLDKLTSRLQEVQNSCNLFKSLCKHVLDLESILISSTKRRMATIVSNKHGEFSSITSKCFSSSSMYRPNSVRETGHPCLILISNITLPCVSLLIRTFV